MAYKRVNWENLPSTKTPVNADNLNKMDKGIKDLDDLINEQEKVLTNITEIKTENLSFTNPEKFNTGNVTSVKVGKLVFIVGFFTPNTQIVGNFINLKYIPILPDRFWGVLHPTNSPTTYHCYANGFTNPPCLSSFAPIEANVRYWIDIKYITNE